jgi:hypothetical protein
MLLGTIERGFGVADQGLGVVPVVGKQRDAEARAEVQLVLVDLERRQEGVEDLLADLGGILGAIDARQQQQKSSAPGRATVSLRRTVPTRRSPTRRST